MNLKLKKSLIQSFSHRILRNMERVSDHEDTNPDLDIDNDSNHSSDSHNSNGSNNSGLEIKTNGKKLSFSIDSLLEGQSPNSTQPMIPSPNSVSRFAAAAAAFHPSFHPAFPCEYSLHLCYVTVYSISCFIILW
jgi:hypothetical protein